MRRQGGRPNAPQSASRRHAACEGGANPPHRGRTGLRGLGNGVAESDPATVACRGAVGLRVATPSAVPLLAVAEVSIRFGGIVALDGVSFDVAPGQICGLIGPNGSGKTTLFNCLSRLYRYESGIIEFEGSSLLATPRHGIAALG